jgi:hypothetical protein
MENSKEAPETIRAELRNRVVQKMESDLNSVKPTADMACSPTTKTAQATIHVEKCVPKGPEQTGSNSEKAPRQGPHVRSEIREGLRDVKQRCYKVGDEQDEKEATTLPGVSANTQGTIKRQDPRAAKRSNMREEMHQWADQLPVSFEVRWINKALITAKCSDAGPQIVPASIMSL